MKKIIGLLVTLLIFTSSFCGASVYYVGTNGSKVVIPSIATAISASSYAGKELHIDSTYSGTSITFPAGRKIVLDYGGKLNYSSTITFNGDFEADLSEHFTGAGTVIFKSVRDVYPEWWGALADGATDSTDAICAAIKSISTSGGGQVALGVGTYVAGKITMYPKVHLKGVSKVSTILKSSHTDDGIEMASTINSGVAVNTVVSDLFLWNTNGSNTGGGYVDVGGSFVEIKNTAIVGFKYGVIFDQTELATIEKVEFGGQITGGIWLVNGADHTTGALGLFTNRINIKECQINEPPTTIGIIDDGGYAHSFDNNNFNGCSNHIRAAGATPINISNNEMESASSSPIVFAHTSKSGGVVGQCGTVTIESNIIVPVNGQVCINAATGPGVLNLIGNDLGNSSAYKVTGLSSVSAFTAIGNTNLGGPLFSGDATHQFVNGARTPFTPGLTFGGAAVGMTGTFTGEYQRIGNVVFYSINIILTAKGSSTGTAVITGLPVNSIAGIYQGVAPQIITGVVTSTSVGGWIAGGDDTIALQNAQTNYSSALTDANLSNTSTIVINGSYLCK